MFRPMGRRRVETEHCLLPALLALGWSGSRTASNVVLYSHAWIFLLTLFAFVCYFFGSRGFYHRQGRYLLYLGLGILADIFMAIAASLRILPVRVPGEAIPYGSVLFLIHMTTALAGMFGFLAVVLYVWIKGRHRDFPRCRRLTYRLLFPVWAVGATIAIFNFASRAFFQVNLYDFL